MEPVAVAVMVQTDPCAADAVKRPEDLMLPHEDVQTAGRFELNCWVCPEAVIALAGEMVSGEVMVTVAEALLPIPEVGVAVTVQVAGARGAV
jgi:hypothetical protein